jgi:hypothetical protein
MILWESVFLQETHVFGCLFRHSFYLIAINLSADFELFPLKLQKIRRSSEFIEQIDER